TSINLPASAGSRLVFEPDDSQKIILCRDFLISVLNRVYDLLGNTQDQTVKLAIDWLHNLPDIVGETPPFGLVLERGRAEENISTIFPLLRNKIETLLVSTLGDATADRIFHRAYDEFAAQFVGLDTFPALVGLVPHRSLDAEKIRLLSREQVHQVLFHKIESSERLNEELAYRNRQLEEAQIELKAAKDKAEKLALSDSLTDLANRFAFHVQLEKSVARAIESGALVGLMLIDLDGFKEINDTYGHQAGDYVLKEIAGRLTASQDPNAIVGRLGGDEFAILLLGLDRDEDISSRVRTVQNCFGAPIMFNNIALAVAGSIGVSICPDDASTVEELVRRADVALYTSKAKGRGYAVCFDWEMDRKAREKCQLHNDLCHSLSNQEFELYYQPKINLHNSEITGAEVLLRWNHSEFGIVTPDKFIQAAEASGLIVDIGSWVKQSTCRQLHAWRATRLSDVPVAVNVSKRHLLGGSLLNDVQMSLDDFDLEPSLLELDITEGLVIADESQINQQLNQLREMGVKIALDDFGAGYSSFVRLKNYPIDNLKIDRSFVHNLISNPEDRFVCIAAIRLAKNLGLKTIVEGIETSEQLDFFRAIGCDEAQGFYFAKPIPAHELEQWAHEFFDACQTAGIDKAAVA
ncbi:MAG: EAL domain-containing protein, partial [Hyphomicrobiaceae bacterium]